MKIISIGILLACISAAHADTTMYDNLSLWKSQMEPNPAINRALGSSLPAFSQFFIYGDLATAPYGVSAILQDDRTTHGGAEIHLIKSRTMGPAQNGDTIGCYAFDFINSAGIKTPLGAFVCAEVANVTAGAEGTRLTLGITKNGVSTEIIRLDAQGRTLIGTSGADGVGVGGISVGAESVFRSDVDIRGSLSLSVAASPASNSACKAGTIKTDANFIYVCTATATWKRAALGAY